LATQWSIVYRPETLDEVVGQPAAVSYIKGMTKSKQTPNCILLSGQSGIKIINNTPYNVM